MYQAGHYPPPMQNMHAGGNVGAMHSGPNSHSSTTNVVVNQPAPASRGGFLQFKKRDWNAGICGCFDDLASCFCVMLCGELYVFYLTTKMDEHCITPCCVPYALPALRLKLRTAENIKGSILRDCCLSLCCMPCVMCQLRRELKAIDQIQSKALQYAG